MHTKEGAEGWGVHRQTPGHFRSSEEREKAKQILVMSEEVGICSKKKAPIHQI